MPIHVYLSPDALMPPGKAFLPRISGCITAIRIQYTTKADVVEATSFSMTMMTQGIRSSVVPNDLAT